MSNTNKFFYKSIDISSMIASGQTTIPNYNITYNPTSAAYKIVDIGFSQVYLENSVPLNISGVGIEAFSINKTITSTISVPTWGDSIKIYLETTKGLTGLQGAQGAQGLQGLQGEQGGGGYNSLNRRTYTGGNGGPGGPGGPGGEGGPGGDGGSGITTYSQKFNEFSSNQPLSINTVITDTLCTIQAQDQIKQLVVTGFRGSTGQQGYIGGTGGTGAQGEPGGQAQANRDGHNSNGIGATGPTGTVGFIGSVGTIGTVVGNNLFSTTQSSSLTVTNNNVTTYFCKI